MNFTAESNPGAPAATIKVFGVGGAGGNAVGQMTCAGFSGVSFAVLNTDAQALAQLAVSDRIQIGEKITRGLGTGGDPDVGRTAAEADEAKLRTLCAGADIVFIIAGLGGGTGTGASPVLARVAKESGALVLGIATLPFDFEGARRQHQAQQGLEQFKAAADVVICLPNQKMFKLLDEKTSVVEAFQATNELLAQGVRGIWRLLSHGGMINVDFADLCAVVRGRHAESSFATVEAAGANRGRDALEKLLASPLLEGGQALNDADAVLVSLVGGPEMTMADVNRVMEQINRQCENANIKFGATVLPGMAEHFSITLIAARRHARPEAAATGTDTEFLDGSKPVRPAPRFLPPPPVVSPELLDQQAGGSARQRKKLAKMRQSQLPLEIVSKGRFEKSEPTIHKGEDLDYPTYLRRGVALN